MQYYALSSVFMMYETTNISDLRAVRTQCPSTGSAEIPTHA